MNFFDAQDQARRTTRRLVFVYVLATALIVVGVTFIIGASLFLFSDMGRGIDSARFVRDYYPLLLGVAAFATLFILGATAYKTAALSEGGGRVATDMGGTLVPPNVQDPLRRRLRNVVEEMAIASGMPVPDIYVLEQESGINAFAAGYAPGDAAIAVTRGALELLNRNELQGVIGHEFSHVLNGDMRLNIRLMGVLFGIMVLGLIGRMILRGGRHTGFATSRRGKGAGAVLIIGLGLTILGAVGVFCARVIKAGVSRQREYLADASAVQFTRQTDGLANALKKIGGYGGSSLLRATDPEEVSHMLFGIGSRLSGMFATHPPLTERIQALDPNFKASDYPTVDLRLRSPVEDDSTVSAAHEGLTTALAGGSAATLSESINDMVGDPEVQHVTFASHLRRSVPGLLYDAAHSHELAYLLVIALILDGSGRTTERQLALTEEQLGRERTQLIRQYYDGISNTGAEYRLPLMGIAFPALKLRPAPQLGYLIDLAGRLIEVDGQVDLYEYCYYRILVSSLGQANDPSGRQKRRHGAREPVRRAAADLLRVIARHGHTDDAERRRAYAAGISVFGKWGRDFTYEADHEYSVAVLDKSLEMLLSLDGDSKQMLLKAVTAVVMSDKTLSVAETELIRAICASLDCPLPPILIDR
ncbi:MAG: M48 family metallopeptidase [Gammaproteobacteria bacterium]|nr:M48 family metallopeptidase [Gammaproteobacteria bacterium]